MNTNQVSAQRPRLKARTDPGDIIPSVDAGVGSKMETITQLANLSSPPSQYEFIDSAELASRWALPESWVREQVRSRAADPLPHIRFGKYVRFRWASPELEAWAERRIINGSNRDVGRVSRKEIV